jgi:type IX secretion system PorP/SprF family membrane protein
MKYSFSIIIVLILTAWTQKGFSQEYGQYSQYTVSPILINPALAGFSGGHQFLLNYRRQWSGFPGTPHMVTFNYNGSIAETSGVGVSVFNERVGGLNRFRAGGMYGFQILAGDFKIGLGLGADYQQHRLGNDAVLDPSLDPNDPIVQAAADGLSYFDANFGAYAQYKNGWYLGLSAPHLVRARLSDIENLPETSSLALRSFTAHLGTRIALPGQGLTLDPSVMVRRILTGPVVLDLNLITSILDEQLYAGLTYRYTVDAGSGVGVLLGARIQKFSVFYQYDAGFGSFQNYNSGAHEIGIIYRIPKK